MKGKERQGNPDHDQSLLIVRAALAVFIAGLVFSGLTAFFLPWEVTGLLDIFFRRSPETIPFLAAEYEMLVSVERALEYLESDCPQFFLGTDYLGFAHLILAVLFIGPLLDPVRNIWVIRFGIISSILVIPSAFLFGAVRGAPFVHYLIDSSFGAGALILLYIAHRETKRMQTMHSP